VLKLNCALDLIAAETTCRCLAGLPSPLSPAFSQSWAYAMQNKLVVLFSCEFSFAFIDYMPG
jgi:hypothetical protein